MHHIENKLFVSVVTIARNPGAEVQRTIDSIESQTYPTIEWIVVDGASTDGSLRRYQQARRISNLISEPDSGIASAMNKGLAHAKGDAVIYVNAGDALATPLALADIVRSWDTRKREWATGDTVFCSKRGQPVYTRRERATRPEALVDRGCRIQHVSSIVLRKTLLDAGGFDARFRIAMDYELWLKLISQRIYPQLLGFAVGKFYLGGSSSDLLKRFREDRRARELHGFSDPSLETRLATMAYLKQSFSLLRHFRAAYVVKEWLRI